MVNRRLQEVGKKQATGNAGNVCAIGILDIAIAPGRLRIVAGPIGNEEIFIIERINEPGLAQLLQIVYALGLARLLLALGDDRKEQRRQNCNNRNDDEQLYQRERSAFSEWPRNSHRYQQFNQLASKNRFCQFNLSRLFLFLHLYFSLGGGLKLIQFVAQFFLGFFVHPVNEQDAVQMIHFMLDGAREQAAGAKFKGLEILVQRLDLHKFRPGNFPEDFRETEAAFRGFGGFAEGFDLGIDEDERHERFHLYRFAIYLQRGGAVFGIGYVNDGHLERLADLLGGQTDAVAFVHGFKHVLNELFDFRRQLFNRLALLPQDWPAIFNDFKNHVINNIKLNNKDAKTLSFFEV